MGAVAIPGGNLGIPSVPGGETIVVGDGVQRVGTTDYPKFSGGSTTEGGGAYVTGGVIAAKLDADGAVEVVGGEVTSRRAGGTLINGSNQVAPNLGDQAMTVVDDEVVISYARQPLDISDYASSTNPNGMVFSITHISGNTYEWSITGDALIRDSIAEGVGLYFPIVDAAGNAVDITLRKHTLRARITVVSATPGNSGLFMFGVKTVPGTPGSGIVRLAGITTAASGAIEASGATTLSTNSNTTTAGLSRIDICLPPMLNTSGDFEIGQMMVNRFNSSGARVNGIELSTASEASPGTPMWCAFLGIDALSITVPVTVRLTIECVATQTED